MLNKAQLIGYLGSDPEVRYTQEGEAIARFRLATHDYRDGNGEKQNRTEWHNVVLFGRLAEIAKEHLSKGSLVYVEGRLQTRSWDKDGETRYTTEIVAESMKMLPSGGGKTKGEPDAPKAQKVKPIHSDGPF
ncbi:single-stranded DNA-binding protein [Hydrogenophilus thermoluteolus]|uniref:single-stranded DNA-binding protein n=1 Tax=Hydrogenophilus thermoluteolus TaxID=297 RepID=UPI00249FDB14|nr:single-stranded DNA-binding protein [Hydrogenophilus thermoluteolus]GLW61699.1 single-stranded DNA-binding protein [Hydrogenophilus thermoluteolus]